MIKKYEAVRRNITAACIVGVGTASFIVQPMRVTAAVSIIGFSSQNVLVHRDTLSSSNHLTITTLPFLRGW